MPRRLLVAILFMRSENCNSHFHLVVMRHSATLFCRKPGTGLTENLRSRLASPIRFTVRKALFVKVDTFRYWNAWQTNSLGDFKNMIGVANFVAGMGTASGVFAPNEFVTEKPSAITNLMSRSCLSKLSQRSRAIERPKFPVRNSIG